MNYDHQRLLILLMENDRKKREGQMPHLLHDIQESAAQAAAENNVPRTDDMIQPLTINPNPKDSRLQLNWRKGFNDLFGVAGEMSWDGSTPRNKYKLPVIQIGGQGEIDLLVCGRTVYDAVLTMIGDPSSPAHQDILGAGFGVRVRRTGLGIETRYTVEYISHQEFIANQPLPNVPHLDDGDRILDI